ncbi:hypothetical protein Hdeb2414_s0056g00757501 [Helianthus debilis subsp. tardiflorus]
MDRFYGGGMNGLRGEGTPLLNKKQIASHSLQQLAVSLHRFSSIIMPFVTERMWCTEGPLRRTKELAVESCLYNMMLDGVNLKKDKMMETTGTRRIWVMVRRKAKSGY